MAEGPGVWRATATDTDPEAVGGGIWMAGTPPAVLADGSVVFTTGNGSLDPDRGSYGCSLVRLAASALRPGARENPVGYFSPKGVDSNECFVTNREMASSAPSTMPGSELVVVGGKDGRIRSFEARALKGPESLPSEVERMGESAFGQVAVFPGPGKLPWVVAGGMEFATVAQRVDAYLAEPSIRGLDRAQQRECLGFVRKSDGGNGPSFVTLFGRAMDPRAAVVPVGSAAHRELMTTAHRARKWYVTYDHDAITNGWTALREISPHFRFWRPEEKAPAGWRKQKLYWGALQEDGPLYVYKFFERPIVRAGRGDGGLEARGAPFLRDSVGAVMVPAGGEWPDCEAPPLKGWMPLYRVSFTSLPDSFESVNWRVRAYELQADRSIKRVWSFSQGGWRFPKARKEMLFNTNLFTAFSPGAEQGVVLQPVLADPPYVQLLDVFSGRPLGTLPFTGGMHFSYPVTHGKYVLVPTQGDGLFVYEAKFRLSRWLRFYASSFAQWVGELVYGSRDVDIPLPSGYSLAS
jgi:hypothetical protein